ncbi:hypothetical protein CBR_g51491 [Chara braunii]|uniref:DUF659 domain-containing protein n=1 Tax=Chara braunii TaxID=69332 RepID=A0A388K6C6_CHABU|nr:hypothetical protein CBR_g51491 [Chara braunii]|eukprot:GBG65608.1 hypothetical protein CBR_g51491 [Chara braunii]
MLVDRGLARHRGVAAAGAAAGAAGTSGCSDIDSSSRGRYIDSAAQSDDIQDRGHDLLDPGGGVMTGGVGSSGAGGSGGAKFNPLSENEMAKLRRGNIVWNFVTAGQYGGSSKAARHFTQSKFCKAGGMRVLAELWNNTDYTFVSSTAQRVQRWMADEGIRDMRAPAGGQRQRMDDVERDDIQDALDEEEGREGGAREGAVADEADEAVGEPNLPGEEVVMTSRGVGRAGPATRAPRPKVERARREKRAVGQAGVEVPDTGREKRARQTTIDEMYAREKLAEFTDAVTAGASIPSQRAKVATMVSEVRTIFRHSGATILFDGRKSRSGKPLVNFLVGGANGALLYATVARDGPVRDTVDVVYRRWRAIILSFPAKDVIGFCTNSANNYTAAARRFATDPEPDIRRFTWHPCSTHVCNLMLSDIGTRVVWVKDTIIRARALVQFIKSHGGGRDDMDSFTSVITGDVPSTAQASGSSRAGGGRGGRSHAEVRVDDSGEQQPRGGLRQTGRRWEVRSDSEAEGEAEDEEVPLRDRRFSPSHHPISAQPEALRRSERLASAAGRDRTHDGEDRGGERTPSDAGIRPRSPSVLRTQDFDVVGLGGSLGDFSKRDARLDREEEERLRSLPQWESRFAYLDEQHRQRDLETGGGGSRNVDDSGVPEEEVQGEFDYEGQDVTAGGGSGGGRRGDEETAGVPEGQDVVMGGGSPSGGRGDSETAGDEGQGAAMCGRGEGGPGGDGDTVGGDDGPDGDDDDDHGPEDDPYRLASVLRDPTVPPLRPEDKAHTFFDVDALAQALTDDRFAHVSRKSGKHRAPGRVYSPPPFTVQSPHWSGSSLSGVRGRDSGAGEVGSDGCSDNGRDSAGSMPPPPAWTPEARVDTGDGTAAPGVAHSGGSLPTVRGGVGGEWSAVRRVGDRLRADYDAGRCVFTGRTTVQTQAAEGGSGRPRLQMAGRMLGLSRMETRRSFVLEAAGTSTEGCGESSSHRARRGC